MHESWKTASREKLLEALEWQGECTKAAQEVTSHYRAALRRIGMLDKKEQACPQCGCSLDDRGVCDGGTDCAGHIARTALAGPPMKALCPYCGGEGCSKCDYGIKK